MQYRLMIHPSGEFKRIASSIAKKINKVIYGIQSSDVVYQIKTVKKQTNPRKLFIYGNGGKIKLISPMHITISPPLIAISELEIIPTINKLLNNTSQFRLMTKRTGDYGENFTLYIEFNMPVEAKNLLKKINIMFERFIEYKELRDNLHTTLVYDDVLPKNFQKAKDILRTSRTSFPKFGVREIWLWRINSNEWVPIKKFKLKAS